jgi:UDPglucose--hexose-1-phosphate uridylyltransferase
MISGAASRSLLSERPHRRFNALTGQWVFVSPHRTQRPWQGKIESVLNAIASAYDPDCYLCPGNRRANGDRNPNYASTYVFDNDFPAFLETTDSDAHVPDADSLLRSELHSGTCRVLCYSPDHNLSLAQMAVPDIRSVIELWAHQSLELGQRWQWVQIFENRGELMGCSNPHPHGQIWAGDFMPTQATQELEEQSRWLRSHDSPLLLDYVALERREGDRLVVQNEHWVAVVPWWAGWPFETLLVPRRHVQQLVELSSDERGSLAEVLKRLLGTYDNLFDCSFPYSFGWHSAPYGGEPVEGSRSAWQLHAHFFPPLLRSASVRKFMVGYELLAEVQRDITPEQAAERLRACVGKG